MAQRAKRRLKPCRQFGFSSAAFKCLHRLANERAAGVILRRHLPATCLLRGSHFQFLRQWPRVPRGNRSLGRGRNVIDGLHRDGTVRAQTENDGVTGVPVLASVSPEEAGFRLVHAELPYVPEDLSPSRLVVGNEQPQHVKTTLAVMQYRPVHAARALISGLPRPGVQVELLVDPAVLVTVVIGDGVIRVQQHCLPLLTRNNPALKGATEIFSDLLAGIRSARLDGIRHCVLQLSEAGTLAEPIMPRRSPDRSPGNTRGHGPLRECRFGDVHQFAVVCSRVRPSPG